MGVLGRLFKGELGIKTLLGAALIAVSIFLPPEQQEILFRIGEAIGLFGLRDALAKLKG